MNIEKLTKAFATYFKEDADIVRQIIIDNIDFVDMVEPTEDQVRRWSTRIEDEAESLDEGYGEDMTDEQFQAEAERIRSNPEWMNDPDLVDDMEKLARDVFASLDTAEQTRTLLDMVLNLCDEIDHLKNRLDNE